MRFLAFAMALASIVAGPCWSADTPTAFATFIGDSSSDYQVARIRADAAGDTYIAGTRVSGSLSEIFVTILDPSGNISAFTTLSGKGSDRASDVVVDASGSIYVSGTTSSIYFPLRGALQTTPGPGFLVKFSPDLGELLYATYFPGAIAALAVDSSGNMYVTGETDSTSFPVTAGLPAGSASERFGGAFVTKIAAAGDHIAYSTLLVGTEKNCGCCSLCFLSVRSTAGVAIALDSGGSAYVAGDTDTYDLPTTAGVLAPSGTGAFVLKVNAAGTALEFLTYIGATYYPLAPNTNPANIATSIAVDAAGDVYVAGNTFDPNFPATAGAFQTTYSGPSYPIDDTELHPIPTTDAFVLKLKPDASGAVWGTYIGGPGADTAQSLALDPSGVAWISGTTASADFPNAQGWSVGGDFIVGVNASGASLNYAARYPTGCVETSIALDSLGAVHAAGPSGLVAAVVPSSPPPTMIFGIVNAAYGSLGGQAAPGLISIYGSNIGPAVPAAAPAGAKSLPTSLGGVTVMADGYAIPLLYVSESQINAAWSETGETAELSVVNNNGASPNFPIFSVLADPQVFQNVDGTAAALNQHGSVNSAANPAKAGSIVSIWVTGIWCLGETQYCCAIESAEPAEIVYAGAYPGAPGAGQINFLIPSDAPSIFTFAVATGGQTSSNTTINVTP